MMWLAMQGKMLTKERLQRLGIGSDCNGRVLCEQQQMEDAEHLFCDCEIPRSVWEGITNWLGINMHNQGVKQSILLIKKKRWKKFKKEIIAAAFGAMIHGIWLARNGKILRNHNVNIEYLVQQIQITVRERVAVYRGSKFARKCVGFLTIICTQ